VKRLIVTSSEASIVDFETCDGKIYTEKDWNPITLKTHAY